MRRYAAILLTVCAIAGVIGWALAYARARWRVATGRDAAGRALASMDYYEKLKIPAPGRVEYVSAERLCAAPEAYDGKRIILAGIWTTGFETSQLAVETPARRLSIWVEWNWERMADPMSDFSHRKDRAMATTMNSREQVVAEGTFHFEKQKGTRGFGHLGAYDAFFLIDRMLRSEPLDETATEN